MKGPWHIKNPIPVFILSFRRETSSSGVEGRRIPNRDEWGTRYFINSVTGPINEPFLLVFLVVKAEVYRRE